MSNTTASVTAPVKNYPGVQRVTAAANHRLLIKFDNGDKRIFDVTPLLTLGRFQTLTAPETFEKVRVAFDTVEWENGLDIDPEYLYQGSVPLESE